MNLTHQATRQHAARDDLEALARRLQLGDRMSLSRLLTLAAGGRHEAALSAALAPCRESAVPMIALTGSGGVGKSSLLGAVAAHFAGRGERIGVLACDPESPITGGALLGDRCRIAGTSASERIFIRSLAVPSGQQGVARNTERMLAVMRRFPFDRIFVETVGAGQGDVAVRSIADVVVLVLQPQAGDELQWEKAGILEIADIVVINKSDLSGADETAAEVTQQLALARTPGIPVVKVSVAKGQGTDELCRSIELLARR